MAALILWIMGATGTLWWLWAWGAWMAFNLLALVLYPTLIAPLFNKFEPLPDESLKARVQALMARCGFAAKGLFVMDGSRRSAHANAYFTGFGAAKRVVFFDTLLAKLNHGEVEAVLAHELGHFLGNRRHSDTPGNLMSYQHTEVLPFLDEPQQRRLRERLAKYLRTGELRALEPERQG